MFFVMSEIHSDGREQATMTLSPRLMKTVKGLKDAGRIGSVSEFFNKAGFAYLEETTSVRKADIVAYVVFPWVTSILLLLWSQHARDLSYSFFIFYANLGSFGIAIAGVYWLYAKLKE